MHKRTLVIVMLSATIAMSAVYITRIVIIQRNQIAATRKIMVNSEMELGKLRNEFYERFDENCGSSQCGEIGGTSKSYANDKMSISFGVLSCIPDLYSKEWLLNLKNMFLRNGIDFNGGGVLRIYSESYDGTHNIYHGVFRNKNWEIVVDWHMIPIPYDGHKEFRVDIHGSAF